ncbi:MAG: hypothetical protein ABMA13_10740 [Chthoniobacteraceae bacterium]
MAQARQRTDPEISLFPFLSILVCLIGALVLLIVILTMVQSMLGDGRSVEEFVRAREADKLRRQTTVQKEELEEWKKEEEQAKQIAEELKLKRERYVLLRRRLDVSSDDKKKMEETNAELQKELENMITQLEVVKKELPPIQAEIAKLKAEIVARKKNIDAKPTVVVQPSGSGAAGTEVSKLFFVECNASGIVVHREGEEPLRLTTGTIGTDAGYDAFLKQVAAAPKSMLLFLLRDDGLASYNRAAGWAEATFEVRTGKIPLPGQGAVDLSLFNPVKN